jgi:hypothetical protein
MIPPVRPRDTVDTLLQLLQGLMGRAEDMERHVAP